MQFLGLLITSSGLFDAGTWRGTAEAQERSPCSSVLAKCRSSARMATYDCSAVSSSVVLAAVRRAD
eukprot:9298295-Pyramimonas_sp.AAC.1